MRKIIIPLNAFNEADVKKNGQYSYLPLIFNSGAYGVEIRRELLDQVHTGLEKVRNALMLFSLFTVYSAPIEVWKVDGSLNKEGIKQVFEEAQRIEANWIKMPLGFFHQDKSDLSKLKDILNSYQDMQLFIENDQTKHGGVIHNLYSFFESAYIMGVPVKMTFDSGNWLFQDQNIQEAIDSLSKYVSYLHLKHVEEGGKGLVTVPLPVEDDASWRNIVQQFSDNMIMGLEFPLEASAEDLKKYIELVSAKMNKEEGFICNN